MTEEAVAFSSLMPISAMSYLNSGGHLGGHLSTHLGRLDLLTSDLLVPALQPVFDRFEAAGGDPALLRPLLGVLPQYLEASLDEMRTRFGTIEDYFSDGLGLDREAQTALRATFTS